MALTQTTAASVSLATSWNGTTNEATTSVTVASGDSALLVRIVGADPRMPPAAVTFNGSPCTQVISISDADAREAAIFELLTLPAAGSYTLSITNANSATYRVLVSLLNGGGDTVVRGTQTSANGFSTTPTVTVTTVSGDLVFDVANTISAPTVGAGQTEQMNADAYSAGSLETASGASTVMSWSQSNNRWCIAAVPYRVTATASRRRPTFLTTRRNFKQPVSRIATRTWAGPPTVPSIEVGPEPDVSSSGFSRRRTAAFVRKNADFVNRSA
jgi:hypothetical protein